MGEYIGTIKVSGEASSGRKKKKPAKAARKASSGKRRIHIRGRIKNNPKRTQALVKELRRLAAKYRFKVREE